VTGLEVPVPPLDAQEEIVGQIESVNMDRINRAVEDINELSSEYGDSMLAHAFKAFRRYRDGRLNTAEK